MNVLYYTEINTICIILLTFCWFVLYRNNGQMSYQNIILKRLLWITNIFCISDMLSGILRGKKFFGANALIQFTNLVYLESLAIISFLWLMYVIVRLYKIKLSNLIQFLISIPLTVFTFLVILNPTTNFLFNINKNNLYVRGEGVIIHWIVNFAYLFAAAVIVVTQIFKTKSKFMLLNITPLLYFSIIPTITAIIQMEFYGVTSTQVGITISLIQIILVDQKNIGYTDPLTGLNNRQRLFKYIDSYLSRMASEKMSIIIIDINGFKQINDNYGHLMGDNALIKTSLLIKNAIDKSNKKYFLCRYGGDEFVICGIDINDEEIDSLISNIHSEFMINGKIDENNKKISVSIGRYSRICYDNDEINELFKLADDSMYDQKKKYKMSIEK